MSDTLKVIRGGQKVPSRAERKASEQTQRAVRVDAGTPLDYVRSLMAKPVPPEWEADLRSISPVSDAVSYLIFSWKRSPLDVTGDGARWWSRITTFAPNWR